MRSFVRSTLLDHFVVGDVGEQETIRDGDSYRTLSGKEVIFSRDPDASGGRVYVNGTPLVEESGTPVPHGSLLFVDRLLFVDHDRVEALARLHPWLESGPLLPGPWMRSQFLSHALRRLEEREGFAYMAEYMNATEELGRHAQGYGE